jgi:hypothetical protein
MGFNPITALTGLPMPSGGGLSTSQPAAATNSYNISPNLPASSFTPGTYDFGDRSIPAYVAAAQQQVPNTNVNELFQQPRQVPQGQATANINNLMPEYNTGTAIKR